MGRSYRINVRFDPDDPEEAALLQQLQEMSCERDCSLSRLIIELLKEFRRTSGSCPFSLEDIRQVFQEELETVSFFSGMPAQSFEQAEISLTEEEQEENDRSVLEDLEMFG